MCMPNDRMINAVNDLIRIKAEIEELQAEETELQEEIKNFMGDDELMFCGDNRITYKTVTSRRVDTTELKKVLGEELISPFMKTITTRRFSVN